jgi:putative endonuclease
MNKISVGKIWEDRVAAYLEGNGYTILERNFRFHKKEIDIIAEKDDLVVFVEVKYRKDMTFGTGLDAVTTRKRGNIQLAAVYYIDKNRLHNCNVRFDVASIEQDKLLYIEDAFQFKSDPLWRK